MNTNPSGPAASPQEDAITAAGYLMLIEIPHHDAECFQCREADKRFTEQMDRYHAGQGIDHGAANRASHDRCEKGGALMLAFGRASAVAVGRCPECHAEAYKQHEPTCKPDARSWSKAEIWPEPARS